MKTKPITVISHEDGTQVDADAVVCPECGGVVFVLFFLKGKGDHAHLQCVECDVTLCGHEPCCGPETQDQYQGGA
mgnify:FL=1